MLLLLHLCNRQKRSFLGNFKQFDNYDLYVLGFTIEIPSNLVTLLET